MRAFLAICALPLLSLSACGGAGPETVGSIAPPAGTSSTTPSTFIDVATATDFSAIGGFQSLDIDSSTGATLYQGDANNVKAPGGTVNYDPRDGIFTLTLSDTNAGVSHSYRFQDPEHRSTPATAIAEIPNYSDFNYLQLLDDATTSPQTVATFFYQRPGSQTNYVTLAGFDRTSTTSTDINLQRGAFVFGQLTPINQVPLSGTASYTGGFLATMINNTAGVPTSATQWISGSSAVSVDFGHSSVDLSLTGTLSNAYIYNVQTASVYAGGTSFNAHGTATINLTTKGGFTGQFTNACFAAGCGSAGAAAVDFASISAGSSTAGASSIDGAFYGPNAVNVGGSFRIVGGVPNTRVDILGAFTGAKQ